MNIDCPTIIPYMGGKFELSKKLIPMIPKHTRYIEMFFGGGSMFFRKAKADFNILNDKHNDLINLYLTVMNQYEQFQKECNSLLKSRYFYTEFKQYLKSEIEYENMPNAYRASRYYYVIMNAFNHTFYNPIAKEKNSWNDDKWKNLIESKKKLEDTMIENLDFRELFDRYPTKKDDFWYFDPPYVVAGERGDYYFHALDNKDHEDMANIAQKIDDDGGKFMISYDDHTLIHKLYNNYQIKKIPIRYSGQLVGDDYKNELVITNYEPINQQLTLI